MANFVGTIVERAVVGPAAFGPDPGDTVCVAVLANRGPADVPTLVTSFGAFTDRFGEATVFSNGTRYSPGYEVLKRFFDRGRTRKRAFVVRIVGANAVEATEMLVDRNGGGAADTVLVTAKGEGTWGNNIYLVVANGTLGTTWRLTVYDGDPAGSGVELEDWDNIPMTDAGLARVTNGSLYVSLTNQDSATAAPDNRPATGTFQLGDTQAGVDDNAPNAAAIVGTDSGGVKTALKAFRSDLYGRGFLMAPDLDTDSTVRTEMLAQAEAHFRAPLFSVAEGQTPAQAITDVANVRGFNAGYYYPRARVEDALTGETKTIPVTGDVLAYWLDAIEAEGPGKAPAGPGFPVRGGLGLETQANGQPLIDAATAELLVAAGVNPVWDRDGSGPKVWGARSTSDEPEWKYLHAGYCWSRIASAFQRVADGLVYKVADDQFFSSLEAGGYAFMADEFDLGAFAGELPLPGAEIDEEVHAFSVRSDVEMLSAADKQNGIVKAEVWFKEALTAETIRIKVAKRTAT